jgi:hypothetical protein
VILRGPLRYRIGGASNPYGETGCVTEVSYDSTRVLQTGQSVKYGNLFFEKYGGSNADIRAFYGPYLHDSDTAEEYNEGQIDPQGAGWNRNLDEQFERAKSQGFQYIELDNPDAYHVEEVIAAVDRAWQAHLWVLAKNPLLVEGDNTSYLAHPAIVGCIVEKDSGTVDGMEVLRRNALKPILPIWFVAFDKNGKGPGWSWIHKRAEIIQAKRLVNMGCTYSPDSEYSRCQDILRPTVIE